MIIVKDYYEILDLYDWIWSKINNLGSERLNLEQYDYL